MKKKFILTLHSVVDIITNSSSEIYTLSSNSEDIFDFIKSYAKREGFETGNLSNKDYQDAISSVEFDLHTIQLDSSFFDKANDHDLEWDLRPTIKDFFSMEINELRAYLKTLGITEITVRQLLRKLQEPEEELKLVPNVVIEYSNYNETYYELELLLTRLGARCEHH